MRVQWGDPCKANSTRKKLLGGEGNCNGFVTAKESFLDSQEQWTRTTGSAQSGLVQAECRYSTATALTVDLTIRGQRSASNRTVNSRQIAIPTTLFPPLLPDSARVYVVIYGTILSHSTTAGHGLGTSDFLSLLSLSVSMCCIEGGTLRVQTVTNSTVRHGRPHSYCQRFGAVADPEGGLSLPAPFKQTKKETITKILRKNSHHEMDFLNKQFKNLFNNLTVWQFKLTV